MMRPVKEPHHAKKCEVCGDWVLRRRRGSDFLDRIVSDGTAKSRQAALALVQSKFYAWDESEGWGHFCGVACRDAFLVGRVSLHGAEIDMSDLADLLGSDDLALDLVFAYFEAHQRRAAVFRAPGQIRLLPSDIASFAEAVSGPNRSALFRELPRKMNLARFGTGTSTGASEHRFDDLIMMIDEAIAQLNGGDSAASHQTIGRIVAELNHAS